LVKFTKDAYRYANSMQTSQRKIPVSGGKGGQPANYRWDQLLPTYEKELADFQKQVAALKAGQAAKVMAVPLVGATIRVVGGGEMFELKAGERMFVDRDTTLQALAPELAGLTGMRTAFGGGALEVETDGPVQLLVGYFKSDGKEFLQVPKLETDAAAADVVGPVVIENAATIVGMPGVDVRVMKVAKGRTKVDLHGMGAYVVLGVVRGDAKIEARDAGLKEGLK
jgi:hypothetical protein